MKDYQQLDASVAHSAEMLEQALPAVLQPFQDMAKSAKGEGAIPINPGCLLRWVLPFPPTAIPVSLDTLVSWQNAAPAGKKSPKSPVFVSA